MKSTAKKLVLAAALIGATLTGAEQASAMPLASVSGVSQSAPIEHIGWRCGPGWHANPWGRCVPNRGGFGPRRRFRRW
jgi:Spy/CpxP family protein refolding chaperone